MNKISLTSIILLFFVTISCTPTTNPHFKVGKPYTIQGKQYVPNVNPKYAEVGIASWYGNGDGFHNKLTANGELFSRNEMTAAHKTLPLPSIVTVTNLENSKVVKLRVNDRGPFVKGRIIDVSEKAAKELGFHAKGSAKVLVELDREESLKALGTVPISEESYSKIKKSYDLDLPDKEKKSLATNTQVIIPEQPLLVSAKTDNIKVIKAPITIYEKSSTNINIPKSMSRLPKATDRIIIREEIVKPTGYNPVISSPKTYDTDVTSITTTSTKNNGRFYVQVASVTSLQTAAELSNKVSQYRKNKIVEADINGKQHYRIRIGSFNNKSEAQSALNNIKENGFKDAYIVSQN